MVEAWGPAVTRLLTTVDMSSDGRLTRLSQHDQIEVDDGGRLSEVANRLVLRASHDGADRWIAVWDAGHAERLPEIIAGQHCRLRRLNVDWVGELLFDTPLARGQTIILEYRIVYPIQTATKADTFVRRFHRTTRDYVLQARFDPTALPTRCVRLGAAGNELVPDPNGSAHLVEFNVAGTVGIRWDM
jgi:hypothetical protein